jgi:murein DD-endopeptidase MepM/ murein hydrolase activator NlpD
MRIPSRTVSLRAALAMVMVSTSIAGGMVANADTSDDLAGARARLETIRSTIAREEGSLATMQEQMNALAGEIERMNSALASTEDDIRAVTAALRKTSRRIAVVRAELEDRAAEAFMDGPASDLMFLLGSATLGDLSDRSAALEALGQADADLENRFRVTQAELEASQAQLDELEQRQRDALASLRERGSALKSKFAEQQSQLDRLDALRSEAARLVEDLGRQLEAELAPPPVSTGGGSGDGIPGPLYACPVPGPRAYADTFGDIHEHPGWTHTHTGNDISAPYGAPIVAPFDGRAVSGSDEDAGIYVTVSGSQGFVQMLHMSRLGSLGEVSKGDVVGYIGTTGNASGPHTHFEWHPGNGPAADPYPYLNEVC